MGGDGMRRRPRPGGACRRPAAWNRCASSGRSAEEGGMPDRDDLRTNPRETPLVGRPRGAAWRTLQADGVVWEGQVFLVGDDVDLAARMIVTHRSVAFARGGAVVLDIP